MKVLVKAAALVAMVAVPLVSFAQSSQPVTRAQVRTDLVQLENAGYHASDFSDTNYPTNILAAEAKVAAQKNAAQDSGYGPSTSVQSQSGQPGLHAVSLPVPPSYAHH